MAEMKYKEARNGNGGSKMRDRSSGNGGFTRAGRTIRCHT